MQIVSDASAIVAVAMNEPDKAWIIAATVSAEAIAPHTLPFEVANALSSLARRKLISSQAADLAWRAANSVPVTLRDISIETALRLACERRMSAYDGFVLQCAIECRAPLLTLDRSLRRAARQLGIEVLEQ